MQWSDRQELPFADRLMLNQPNIASRPLDSDSYLSVASGASSPSQSGTEQGSDVVTSPPSYEKALYM